MSSESENPQKPSAGARPSLRRRSAHGRTFRPRHRLSKPKLADDDTEAPEAVPSATAAEGAIPTGSVEGRSLETARSVEDAPAAEAGPAFERDASPPEDRGMEPQASEPPTRIEDRMPSAADVEPRDRESWAGRERREPRERRESAESYRGGSGQPAGEPRAPREPRRPREQRDYRESREPRAPRGDRERREYPSERPERRYGGEGERRGETAEPGHRDEPRHPAPAYPSEPEPDREATFASSPSAEGSPAEVETGPVHGSVEALAYRPASPRSVEQAVLEVKRVVDALQRALHDMEEVLELIEDAEQQKVTDEREIARLQEVLRQMTQLRERLPVPAGERRFGTTEPGSVLPVSGGSGYGSGGFGRRDRGERSERDRGDRPEYPAEREDRGDRGDRREGGDRPDRGEEWGPGGGMDRPSGDRQGPGGRGRRRGRGRGRGRERGDRGPGGAGGPGGYSGSSYGSGGGTGGAGGASESYAGSSERGPGAGDADANAERYDSRGADSRSDSGPRSEPVEPPPTSD